MGLSIFHFQQVKITLLYHPLTYCATELSKPAFDVERYVKGLHFNNRAIGCKLCLKHAGRGQSDEYNSSRAIWSSHHGLISSPDGRFATALSDLERSGHAADGQRAGAHRGNAMRCR